MTVNPPSHFGPALPTSSDIQVHDYIQVLMRRRWSFLFAFCVVFCAVSFYTFTMKPVFEASATLHVRDEKGGKGDFLGDMGFSRQNPLEAEIEIIKSRSNAEQVVRRLQLDRRVVKRSRGIGFKLVDFASSVPGKRYRVELTGNGAYRVLDGDGRLLGSGLSGVLLQTGEFRLLLAELRGSRGMGLQLVASPLYEAADELRRKLKATEVGNKTGIIRVSYSDVDSLLAREVVNMLVQVYLEQSVALKTREASKSLEFIEEQMNGVRGDLDTAEKNLQSYKTRSGVLALDREAEELVKKISETEKERTALTLMRRQVEFSLTSLVRALKNGQAYAPAVPKDDAALAALTTRLADLEVQKRAAQAEGTESHPQVRGLKVQIDELQKKLLAGFESSLKNLLRQEASASLSLERYEGQMKRLPVAERDLARLLRHTKVNAEIYTFLLQKHEEVRIAKASTISNINVIDPAIAPRSPLKPNKQKNMTLGLLAGLMVSLGIVFFQEYLDDTIKDADGARLLLNAPVLAVIPFIPRRDGQTAGERGATLITQLEPKSSVSEAFRSLRTSINFSAINRDKLLLLLTSTFPGEGKTTISANLAVTLAQTGARVLLVDCDTRRPQLHNLFQKNKVPGLTELLSGEASREEVLCDTGIHGLQFISAGTTPPNPAELLGSARMADLLVQLRGHYDHILLDAPPVLAVTDAPLLTTRCDMTMVVIETERVPVKAAQRMREMLHNVQAPVAGVIINDKSGRSRERYGYYGGYYGYGDYGADAYYGDEGESRGAGGCSWWRRFGARLRGVR